MSVNWPHISSPKPTEEIKELTDLLQEERLSGAFPVGDKVPGLNSHESKSPMKYAVDYKLVDSDGLVIEDTDYFVMKEFAWDRAKELYELSDLSGTITFREL